MSTATAASDPEVEPSPSLAAMPLPPGRGLRVFLFFSSALLLTGVVSLIFADLLWRTGWSASRTLLLVLFVVLFFFTAVGCMHGVFGFFVRMGGDRLRLTRRGTHLSQSLAGTSTAIICPVYNEDVVRVYRGPARHLRIARTDRPA